MCKGRYRGNIRLQKSKGRVDKEYGSLIEGREERKVDRDERLHKVKQF
jgi:hypothetical protein